MIIDVDFKSSSCDIIAADEGARLGYLGVSWGLGGGNGIGGPPLASFGTQEQKDKFLVPILRGQKTICLGITEPGGGSDVAAVQTSAKPVEGGWSVSGEKKVRQVQVHAFVEFTDTTVI